MKSNSKRVSSITLTILTESPIALSNDQGFGTYNPIKKYFFKDGKHAMTSVATVSYELRKNLILNNSINPDSIVLKDKNLYPNDPKIESDIFGYLIPSKQESKTSPLRIIPFISIHTFKNDTQLITNRGFLDINLGRTYYNDALKELNYSDVQKTQALANEEVFGDYYTYTVTLELDRIGVKEIDEKGNRLPMDRRIYLDGRKEIVKNILLALTDFTREIKHQTVHLKPLAVFGGVYAKVIPYFWNDIRWDDYKNGLVIDSIENTIKDYELSKEGYLIASVDSRIKVFHESQKDESIMNLMSNTPITAIKNIADKLTIGEDNNWYLDLKE